ncbi:MAG TPA: hypothetical protein VK617_11500, partial [Gemmatimonadaceae bacterium]|nr:hypothetical protein [Gemmatimonadaceae bacterium]
MHRVARVAMLALAATLTCCHRSVPEVAAASCDARITTWLLAGPFPLDTGVMRLDGSNIGDPAALFAIAGDLVPETRAMRWRAESSDSMGRIDLYSVFREPKLDDRAAYALTYLVSPEARAVRLAVES